MPEQEGRGLAAGFGWGLGWGGIRGTISGEGAGSCPGIPGFGADFGIHSRSLLPCYVPPCTTSKYCSGCGVGTAQGFDGDRCYGYGCGSGYGG